MPAGTAAVVLLAVPLPSGAAHDAAGAAARFAQAAERRDRADADRLSWPVHGAVTGRFGEPRAGHFHDGIDIPQPVGTRVRAAAPGIVVMREWQDGYGNYTCIAHRTILTCYAHQSRFRVKQGARVERGQVIGQVGDTGTSEAPHLHFEVRQGRRPWGKPTNPLKRLPRG
jgi:murein DD-endopeptidase MepM/ murein hydrolase activator NlpD